MCIVRFGLRIGIASLHRAAKRVPCCPSFTAYSLYVHCSTAQLRVLFGREEAVCATR